MDKTMPGRGRGRRPRRGLKSGVACGVLVLAWLSAFGPDAVCADKTDVVVLKNGDRITGEIRSLSNGLLTYKTDDIGTISVEWERIVRISSQWPFILEDTQGRRYSGAIKEAPDDGRLIVLTDSGPVTLDLVSIVGIARFGERLLQRFQGYLNLGFSLQKAQSNTQLNVAASLNYLVPKWDIRSSLSSYYANQEGVPATTKNSLGLEVMRIFQNRWTAAAFANLEQNTELNLALRVLGGAGIGRYFIRTNRHVLTGVAALDLTRENYIDETPSTTGAEAVFGVSYQTFRYVFPNMDISTSFNVYPSLTTKGRVRFKYQASVRYELFRRFYVTLGFVDNYDSKPGGETTTKNDYGLNFGISWSLN